MPAGDASLKTAQVNQNAIDSNHGIYRLADAEQFVATVNQRDGEACFVIMLDGTLIGACGIDPRDDGAELGYWLAAGYWGRGLMTEAARAVIDYAFGDLRHETLQSGARVSNPA